MAVPASLIGVAKRSRSPAREVRSDAWTERDATHHSTEAKGLVTNRREPYMWGSLQLHRKGVRVGNSSCLRFYDSQAGKERCAFLAVASLNVAAMFEIGCSLGTVTRWIST